MAIQKRFIHFKKFSDFNSKKLSANEANTQYTVGVSGEIQNGEPDVLYQSYCWIKDTQQQWTHGQLYNGSMVDLSQYLTADEIEELYTTYEDLNNKQDVLISGMNIKTINGESIVGSGNIEISGDSSSGGSSAYSEVSHGTSDTTFELTPNTFHVWDEVTELSLTFGSETSGVANEFLFQFTSGSTATTLTLPDDIKWVNDSAPTIEANMIYQVSILKGLASVLEFSNAPESVFPVTLDYSNQDPALNLRVFNEIHSVAQGSDITLNSGDLTFVLKGNSISVVNLPYYFHGTSISNTGYVLYDTGMEYYILNASGSIVYYFYD